MARRAAFPPAKTDPRTDGHPPARDWPGPAGGLASVRRWPLLDLVRGVAIVAMIAYHFCFDLAVFGWLAADFGAWRWVAFRTPILGTFLFVAGVSLGLAEVRGQSPSRFWRRVAVVAGAAALVSLGSYLMFPRSYIYFGVLHGIAVMSVLARPVVRFGGWLVVAGVIVVVAGSAIQHPFFDLPALRWIGMMTFKPLTEDYVPLFPWFGLMLSGVGVGVLAARRCPQRIADLKVPRPLAWVAWLGRHSLTVYLVHQPLLLVILAVARRI
ncbi:MAG: heparan-alpha-glucosaminide N-acetyltransferase [Betaproteobacteria bacterium]